MKFLKISAVSLLRLVYFLPVLGIVVFLVFLFGHPILGPGLPGSDNANFVTLADWLSKWFPRIPFWFPQEGAGMSFTVSYPILNHLIVVLIEKITSQPITVAFRVWSLVTIVLSSVGLYVFTYRLTKNQTVSALSSIFYVLSPITWIFLLVWGFFSDQGSYIFVPLTLICLFLFLDEYYEKGDRFKTRLCFLFMVLVMSILPLAHPNVFVGMLIFSAILFFIYPLLNYRFKDVRLKKVVLSGLVTFSTTFLLAFFWIFPYLRYNSIAAQGAPVARAELHYPSFMHESIYPINFFGLTTETAAYQDINDPPQFLSKWTWRNVSFPRIISILALIGLIGSVFLNRKILALGLANLVPLAIVIFPQITFQLMKFPFSGYLLNWRAAVTPSRFIFPLLAGYGCFVLAHLMTFPISILSKKIRFFLLKSSLKLSYVGLTAALTILISGMLLLRFRSPNGYPDYLLAYGSESLVPAGMLDIRNIWRQIPDSCFSGSSLSDVLEENQQICSNYYFQKYFWTAKIAIACDNLFEHKAGLSTEISELCDLDPSRKTIDKIVNICAQKDIGYPYFEICQARTSNFWEQLKSTNFDSIVANKNLLDEGKHIYGPTRIVFEELPNSTTSRVDVNEGGLMMVEPFYSNTPELPVYFNQGTLIKNFWNYQINAFNDKNSPWSQPTIMYELSKYFGLEYMIMQEGQVPLGRYEDAGWQRLERNDELGFALWRFQDPAGLLRATTKPVVLVIGQDKVDGYFRIFHLANLGAIPYDETFIVKGGSFVDSFSAEELGNFDLVVLEGYAYQNQSKGWRILDEYVKNGGSLLVSTGWQYSSADWQVNQTPDFFPLKTLKWIAPEPTDNYKLQDGDGVTGGVDINKFGPLLFGDVPWHLSTSVSTDLRDWAKIYLSVGSTPIVAGGQYGQGKIIWMGLDLPGHIGAYEDNEEEIKLYKNLVSYLLEGESGQNLSVSFNRNYPDRLEISINESSTEKTAVYWSEAYYPDFKSTLIENGKKRKLKAYKAGPGMTLFVLPKVEAGAKIVYEYKTPLSLILARLVSVTTLAMLIVFVVKPNLFEKMTKLVWTKTGKSGKKFSERVFGSWQDEDEDY